MRVVTNRAPFSHRLMLEHERPALRGVALSARFVFGGQLRAAAFGRTAFVRIVTIVATDLAIQDRMTVCQVELSALVQVTLKTNLGRPFRIEDSVISPATLIMDAARSMTRFTADVFRIFTSGLETSMLGRLEIAHDIRMTFRTRGRADKFRAGNLRRRDGGAR